MSIAALADRMHRKNLRAWGTAPDGRPLYLFWDGLQIPAAWAPPRQTRQSASHFGELVALPATAAALHASKEEFPREPAPGENCHVGATLETALRYSITTTSSAWAGSHYRLELERLPVAST